jgi:hypothetical protein
VWQLAHGVVACLPSSVHGWTKLEGCHPMSLWQLLHIVGSPAWGGFIAVS